MVMAILPLIMGAIAAALIVTMNSEQSAANRLSDSVDSQITSAYYVKDVQGAGYVATQVVSGPYSSVSPQVCPSSGAGQLLLALYHQVTAAGPAFDVGYWLNGTSVLRYSCSLNNNFAAHTQSEVAVADNVSRASAVIEPAQFAQATAATPASWVQTVASTYVQAVTSSSLTVLSTSGFSAGVINVQTPLGSQHLNCGLVKDAVTLASCTPSTSTIPVEVGQQISQNSIGDINLAVSQSPPTNGNGGKGVEYHYSLTASPRTQTPWGAGPGTTSAGGESPYVPGSGGGGPTFLALGTNGISLQGSSNASLTISGDASVDGGSISCGGSAKMTVNNGTLNGVSGVTDSCGSITAAPYQPDPLAPYLPSCFPVQPAGSTTTSGGTLTYWPGRYTSTIPPSNAHGTIYFEPGVYELDAGISISNNQSVQIAPSANGRGVLLYLPGYNTAPGCASAPSPSSLGQFNLGGGGQQYDLPPLTKAQSTASFDGNPNLAGVWLWQDATNPTGASLGGNSGATQTGLAYLPTAIVSFSGSGTATTGQLICAGVSGSGGGSGNGLNVGG
jgi:hypothetical protein